MMISKIKTYITSKILSDDILKKFISGAFWSVLGNVIVKGLSLVAGLFVAKLLGSISFGELSIIKSTLSVFGLLASFGLGFTITKLIGESLQKDAKQVGQVISAANVIIFISSFLFGLGLVLFAPLISIFLYKNESLIIPLRLSGVFLFFNAINTYQLGLISGFQLFKGLARINTILGIVSFPIILLFTYFLGLKGTLIAMICNSMIGCSLNYSIIKKEQRIKGIVILYEKLYKRIRKILSFSLPLALREIIYSTGNWITYYLLLEKSDFGEVGIFNSANQLSQIILFLPGAILGVSLSMLSTHRENKKNYVSLVKKSLLFNFIIVVVVGVFIAIFSGLIYDFYGNSYQGGREVLYVLILCTIPMSFISVFEQICISSSKPNWVTIFTFLGQFSIIVSVVILFYFSEKALSLAYSYLIGYSTFAITMYLFLKKRKMLV
ncbi:oligosaccharide flippase family protein [Aquimarina algiphila]|uniref:oligosaccharide flippase family protein n=1 Tax=Aquimarina algiphila TaxID=2047982 RepID=UPI002492EEBE|nr:oligosaccharide flippase family protein [Aquimarina algiphila]